MSYQVLFLVAHPFFHEHASLLQAFFDDIRNFLLVTEQHEVSFAADVEVIRGLLYFLKFFFRSRKEWILARKHEIRFLRKVFCRLANLVQRLNHLLVLVFNEVVLHLFIHVGFNIQGGCFELQLLLLSHHPEVVLLAIKKLKHVQRLPNLKNVNQVFF